MGESGIVALVTKLETAKLDLCVYAYIHNTSRYRPHNVAKAAQSVSGGRRNSHSAFQSTRNIFQTLRHVLIFIQRFYEYIIVWWCLFQLTATGCLETLRARSAQKNLYLLMTVKYGAFAIFATEFIKKKKRKNRHITQWCIRSKELQLEIACTK